MSDLAALSVAAVVAADYGLEAADLFCARRTATVSEARHVAMSVLREVYRRSYAEVGRAFARDHSTVVAAVRRVRADPALTRRRDRLIERIEAGR